MQIILLLLVIATIIGYFFYQKKKKDADGENGGFESNCGKQHSGVSQSLRHDMEIPVIYKVDPDDYKNVADTVEMNEDIVEFIIGRSDSADWNLEGDLTVGREQAAIVREQKKSECQYYFESRSKTNPTFYFDVIRFEWIEMKTRQRCRLSGRQLFELGENTKIVIVTEKGHKKMPGTKTAVLYNDQLRQADQTVWMSRKQRTDIL